MKKLTIRSETIERAFELLDTQGEHCMNTADDKQKAYYDGMRTMLETILTDNYTKSERISMNTDGRHQIFECRAETQPKENKLICYALHKADEFVKLQYVVLAPEKDADIFAQSQNNRCMTNVIYTTIAEKKVDLSVMGVASMSA